MELFEELHIYKQGRQVRDNVLERMIALGIMSKCHGLTWDHHSFQTSELQS